MQTNNSITMLGTGSAMATRCYNTCFLLSSATTQVLVDAGGGNGILTQLEKASISIGQLHHLFVTHAHTDHILGALWVIRRVIHLAKDGNYDGQLQVVSHRKVLEVLQWMCSQLLPTGYTAYLGTTVVFKEVSDGDSLLVGDISFTYFDIHSRKEPQYGFRAVMPGQQIVVCLGDEPYNVATRQWVEQADWLLSEAFCLYADRDEFKPYEKSHATVADTAQTAEKLAARHLIIYHTEDRHLHERKERYSAEARQYFSGQVVVPDDLERIVL